MKIEKLTENKIKITINIDDLAEKNIDLLITVGEKAFDYVIGARDGLGEDRILHFAEKADLYEQADEIFKAGDVVLVKASRGMEFEQIIEKLW